MILYVDDEGINLKLFKMMFKEKYEVLIAESGEEALNILQTEDKIKVMVTDLRMPRMDGVELARKVKGLNKELACYLLSGYSFNEEIQDALENKLFVGYFQKPLKRDKMALEFDKYEERKL